MGSIPLDYAMVGAIGFLAALLIALMVMPAVHHRAVRLTIAWGFGLYFVPGNNFHCQLCNHSRS